MRGLLYNIGKRVAPTFLKTRWIYRSLTGTESEKIQAEYTMGCHLAYLHTRDANLVREPEVLQRLNDLSDQLSLALVNRERKFQVRCLAGPETNAFALPGGFLFVSLPLLDLCAFDKDEIAFVIAHEMAHVLRSHAVNRIMTSEIVRLFAMGSPARGVLKPVLAQLINRILTQGYSRQQEFEADKAGVRISHVAGYDPTASIRLFQRLQATTEDPDAATGYFSSHPSFSDRINRINRFLAE